MGRGAPNKPGLTYFPKMLDFYEDDKISLAFRRLSIKVTLLDLRPSLSQGEINVNLDNQDFLPNLSSTF